jgi:acyl carrier protein
MNLDDVISQLRTFVRETFEVGGADLDFTDDVNMFDYGYVDSFGAVEIITFVEQRFHVTISDQDLMIHPLNTIREIATLVHQRMAVTK